MRLAILLVLAASCGRPAADDGRGTTVVSRSGLPATDRDPLPYTPPPTDTALAGDTVALSAAGGEDQARQMLPALIHALRDANERELEQLFAEEVGQIAARVAARAGRPRATIVQRMLNFARRSIIASDSDVGDLLDLSAVRVTRASRFFHGRELPRTVRVTDLVVEVPVLEPGRSALRTLLGWSGRGYLAVRPGRDARIVAY